MLHSCQIGPTGIPSATAWLSSYGRVEQVSATVGQLKVNLAFMWLPGDATPDSTERARRGAGREKGRPTARHSLYWLGLSITVIPCFAVVCFVFWTWPYGYLDSDKPLDSPKRLQNIPLPSAHSMRGSPLANRWITNRPHATPEVWLRMNRTPSTSWKCRLTHAKRPLKKYTKNGFVSSTKFAQFIIWCLKI